jgi:hypothetical protein
MFGPIRLKDRDAFEHYGAVLLQEPLKTPLTRQEAHDLREAMAKDRIDFWDYNFRLQGEQASLAVEQVGKDANGRSVIMDYGARRPFFEWQK